MEQLAISKIKELINDLKRFNDSPDKIKEYLSEPKDTNKITAVVFPRNSQEIKEIVSLANKNNFAIYTPTFSGINPKKEGIIIDYQLMGNNVVVDERNLLAEIEPGVTFEQLQEHLKRLSLRIFLPAATAYNSPLFSYLEREIIFAATRYGIKQLAILECILPSGRYYASGSHSLPHHKVSHREDGGPNISKLFFQSQNTFALPVKGKVCVYPYFEKRVLYLVGFNSFLNAYKVTQIASRQEMATEMCLVNREKIIKEMPDINKEDLPRWLLILTLEGGEELVNYYQKAIEKIGEKVKAEEVKPEVIEVIENSWGKPWRRKSGTISFYTTSDRVIEFVTFFKKMHKGNFAELLIPYKRATSIYLHFEIEEDALASRLLELSEKLLDEGAFFNNPPGYLAKKVLSRSGNYYELLRQIKRQFDPNNILNPDQILEV